MSEEIRRCSQAVVQRNCLFAGLGIVVVTVACMDDPAMALLVGGILNLVLAAGLLICAVNAPTRDCRRTEVWMLLKARLKLPLRTAQALIGETLRTVYMQYALRAGLAAAWFLFVDAVWNIERLA